MTQETRVHVRHLRACGFCLIPGGRDWFSQHGLDWRDFVKNGVSADRLLATGDAMAQRVVDIAKKERGQ